VPPNAPQEGSASVLDTADARLTQAVAHVDPAVGVEAVWTQHTVNGPGGRSVVRWYELIPSQLSARQTGTVAESGQDFAFNGAISPTSEGTSAVIDYNASGPASFPRIAMRSRSASFPAGQMSSAATIVASSQPHDDFSCGPPDPCRWGDYAAAVPDPVNTGVVWGTNEFSAGTDWTSQNFAVEVGPDDPVASFSATPASGATGQPVAFDASSSSAGAGQTLARYQWDLDGDGSFETDTGTDPHASHVYARPGTFTARLRVTDSVGQQSDAERTVVALNRPPVAVLRLSRSSIASGRSAQLDSTPSSDPDGAIARHQWDLDGNGSFETDTGAVGATPSVAFTGPRTVTLRVRVTDDLGATADAAATLTVSKPVPPPPTKQCLTARARVKKLATSVRTLKRQVRRAHGARKRTLARKLKKTRRQLASARVRVHTIC
jgi:hypothetical protein